MTSTIEETKTYQDEDGSGNETVRKAEEAGRGQRAPPRLSVWLNADLFKRIVHRLANLPAASTAEHNGANVMKVVTLSAYLTAARVAAKLCTLLNEGRKDSSALLCTHWPLRGHLLQGNQKFTLCNFEHLFQNEMFFFFFLAVVCSELLIEMQSWSCQVAVVECHTPPVRENGTVCLQQLSFRCSILFKKYQRYETTLLSPTWLNVSLW